MDVNKICGIIVPIVTPFTPDERINQNELRRQVNRQIENGIHGIFCFGTNGEGYALNYDEKKLVLETVIDEVRGRVPVYAGTGCVTTRETLRESRMAQDVGADALSVITPSFAVASQDEIYEHYRTVAAAVDLPVILYNIPARTGNAISSATVARLTDIDNIVGAKDSSGNFQNLLAYLNVTKKRPDFKVLAGNDQLILWNLLAGGAGAIAGCANVFPHTIVRIYECFAAGNVEQARFFQDAIQDFRDTFKYGNPNTIIKAAVALSGYDVGPCRAPFNTIPEEGIAAIRNILVKCRENNID